MTRPSVFIGSSSEGLSFARAVRTLLVRDAEITLWNEGFFRPGSTFIETLVNALPRFDFAILVLTPDDLVESRDVAAFGPRDNVVFELGLFMGRLGRERTFVLHQAGAQMKMPSDLAGVTMAQYEWPRNDGEHRGAVGAACDTIREVIQALGVSEAKVARDIRDIRTRQESAETRIQEAERKIERIFLYTMSDNIFRNLKKLASGSFGHFENTGTLRRELRHLRDIGYVTAKGHIGDLPDEGNDLSEYIAITSVGRQFVELREALD
jgi:hypothetical protein